MANSPTRAAQLHHTTGATTFAGEFTRWLSGLLETTAPAYSREQERVTHLVILFAIVCVGAVARFWGLGSVGLHGDEETMGLAVRHILQDGMPVLPSGMFYPRGLTQLYLMAMSVQIFGETEWALRMPSAVGGVLLIVLAYGAGRRFLRPSWNLAFAASIALLPEMIIASQTARMYVFMLVCIAAAMICIFAWERSGRITPLIGAVVLLALGVDFQALAVTSVLLFLLPGLVQQDLRKLTWGFAAVAASMISYLAIDGWVNSQYPVPPPELSADIGPPDVGFSLPPFAMSFQIALWGAGVVVAACAVLVGRSVPNALWSSGVVVLLLACVLCQLTLMYHVAALLALIAFVIALRNRTPATARQLAAFAIGSGVITLIQATLLAARPGSFVKLVGAMVGEPSVWPYVRIAYVSELAAVLTGAAVAFGIFQLSRRRRAPDYAVMAVLGIWLPLLAIGTFLWNVPPRYTAASWLPMLLCAFAFAQAGADWLQARMPLIRDSRVFQPLAAALIALAFTDVAEAASVINLGYSSRHPDHKGAAEFIRSQGITADDVVIAEDVLQQTYYLGSVDYWLLSRKHAWRFVERVPDGRILDFYTHTPVITSAAELADVLQREQGRRIFVIGSGENQNDKRRDMRGDMSGMLQTERFEVVYTGRDHLTQVWRVADAPGPNSSRDAGELEADSAVAPATAKAE